MIKNANNASAETERRAIRVVDCTAVVKFDRTLTPQAAALIISEIERLDHAAGKQGKSIK